MTRIQPMKNWENTHDNYIRGIFFKSPKNNLKLTILSITLRNPMSTTMSSIKYTLSIYKTPSITCVPLLTTDTGVKER